MLSLSPPRISSSTGSQLPHWELPYGDTLLVTETAFRSTPNKELKPSVRKRRKRGRLTNTCVNLGLDPSALVQPWGDTIPADSLTITSWETMSQNHPARQLPDVWPWEMKVTNVCCLKLLSLGVIYCAEIKHYTTSGESYTSPPAKSSFLIYQFIGQKWKNYPFNDNRQMQSAMGTQRTLKSLFLLLSYEGGKKRTRKVTSQKRLKRLS